MVCVDAVIHPEMAQPTHTQKLNPLWRNDIWHHISTYQLDTHLKTTHNEAVLNNPDALNRLASVNPVSFSAQGALKNIPI